MPSSLRLPVISRRYWEDRKSSGVLGCAACPERPLCGGLRPRGDAFSCLDYCCNAPASCQWVCRNNPEQFVARVREVGGFELEELSRLAETGSPGVPDRVPLIYHSSGRHEPLPVRIVAVRLSAMLRRGDHRCKWISREQMLTALQVDPSADVIVDAVGFDSGLERFWGPARAAGAVAQIAALRPMWVLTPNYSVINNVPRWDNLHSMKRIAQIWHEFTASGVPTALHVNARMAADWDRWISFIAPRPEVKAVAFEFATGGRFKERREEFAEGLTKLGNACDGRLRLFLRGGLRLAGRLAASYASVTILDTNSFMKSMKRQRIQADGRGLAVPTWTLDGQPLDDLLIQNIKAAGRGRQNAHMSGRTP